MEPTPADLRGRRVTWSASAYLCVVGFLLCALAFELVRVPGRSPAQRA